jgi:D-aminopeptidase
VKNSAEKPAILLLTDMEGVSGLVDKRLINAGNMFWREYGRQLLTDDVNSVAAACYAKGYKTIYLSEAHYFGMNTIRESLLPFITVLPSCSAQTNFKGSELWDEIYKEKNIVGAIMVGCHAMEGTRGYLPHSWDGGVFRNIKINGVLYGEIGTVAGLLGYYDIPLIAAIGDYEAAQEAKNCIPGIKAISVKELGEDGWLKVLPPEKAQDLIFNEISNALKEISEVRPVKFDNEVNMSFELKKIDKLLHIRDDKRIKIVNENVHIIAENYKEAYDIFWDCYVKIWLGI